VTRVIAKDAVVSPVSVQLLIDLARESAKVPRAIRIDEVVDFSFVDRARKELGPTK
jgi:hypothetical protein